MISYPSISITFRALLVLTMFFLPQKFFAGSLDHDQWSALTTAQIKQREQSGKTSIACWHYQLMQIHDHMINSPNVVSSYVLDKDGKRFRNLSKLGNYAEMLKGSRLEVYETDSACDLVLAFRGTYQGALDVDLPQDINFIPSKDSPNYHPGFFDAAKSYRTLIKKTIADSQKKCGSKELNITVTGHSLGGAIAYIVANVFKDLELGHPELVLFGSPRVVMNSSAHTDKVKAVHYYLDRDPVVLTPPKIMFKELTDNLYRFDRVSVLEDVSVTGHQLFQNHLPSVYVKKLARWCEEKEKPKKVRAFTHTLKESGIDASQRVVRTGVDAAGNKLLPSTNEKGGTLPPVSEAIITYLNAPDNSKGNPEIRNTGDGQSFANQLACGVSYLWGSRTKAGRKYYCVKTIEINEKAKKACVEKCGTTNMKPGGCVRGCFDHLHKFCIGNWACKGDSLSG